MTVTQTRDPKRRQKLIALLDRIEARLAAEAQEKAMNSKSNA